MNTRAANFNKPQTTDLKLIHLNIMTKGIGNTE